VETSTLAVLPALLGMPMLLANYGRLRDQRFGEVLTSYPRASFLTEIDTLTSMLQTEEVDAARTMAWIHENAGPMPAEEMPLRLAGVMRRAISERAGTAARDCRPVSVAA
jgi:hypothetical protein